jgi:hypothetical protein
MSSFQVVVARYNEDIDWLTPIIDNCIIYNKGDPLFCKNEKKLDNVGRESHTYLHHIIENYDTLADIVIFTQANIADHIGTNDINYLFNMYKTTQEHNKSYPIVNYTWNGNDTGCWSPKWNLYSIHGYKNLRYKNDEEISFQDWFLKNIMNVYPNPIYIYCSAIFSVKKELILKHPKSYYEKLIKECDYWNSPIEAHFFERSWYYIFN